jgi:hypothetical protein
MHITSNDTKGSTDVKEFPFSHALLIAGKFLINPAWSHNQLGEENASGLAKMGAWNKLDISYQA